MKNPYEVLGVSPNASDDEIKKAYRSLVRKYHPDKYRDSDLADLATEKMKEVNAAYEEIQKMRENGKNKGPESDASGSGNTSGSSPQFAEIRRMINKNNIQQAENALRSMDMSMQNAEWHFLMGCIALKRGYYVDAQNLFDRACGMDPGNMEYRNARDQLRNSSSSYGAGYRTTSNADTACSCCSNLICADCCCEMMGGDLISCC